MLSTPALCSSWPSSRPDGPAPTMATWVRALVMLPPRGLAPDLGRGLDDEPQLGALRLDGDVVAVHRARKAALRGRVREPGGAQHGARGRTVRSVEQNTAGSAKVVGIGHGRLL